MQSIIYKELEKKKKTLEAKMQIQHRLKRTERERERESERDIEEEDGGAISSLMVSPWVVEVEGLKLQQWL